LLTAMTLKVNEIFYSIQGESSYVGYPCVFVRLTGCNLRCTYCDTTYAYDEGRIITVDELLRQIAAYPCRLVEVTGGEPLLQDATPRLIQKLLDRGHTVLLETNGTLDITPVDSRCIRIMDIKCPSSGEAAKNNPANLSLLAAHDEVKFVIAVKEDYAYAKKMLPLLRQHAAPGHIHFSPAYGRCDPAALASWILEDGLPVRLSLQLHKTIWPHAKRGV